MTDPNKVQRLTYFNGQYLDVDAFQDEQTYHRSMRQRLTQAVHSPGVLNGFSTITIEQLTDVNPAKITVSAGIGIDGQYRELVYLDPDEKNNFQEFTRDNLTSFKGQTVGLYLQYDDDAHNPTSETSGRITERPLIILATLPATNQSTDNILLAYIKVGDDLILSRDDNFASINNKMPAPQLASFHVQGNIGVGTSKPMAGLEINNGSGNDLAIKVSSSGPGWGSGIQFENTGSNKRYGIYVDNHLGSLHISDEIAKQDRILIDFGGNILVSQNALVQGNMGVVGAANIGGPLTLTRGAIVPTVGNAANAGIAFPSIPSPPGSSGANNNSDNSAWIRNYSNGPTGKTALEIGAGGSGTQDDILLMPSGCVGIGTSTPSATLEVSGSVKIQEPTNPNYGSLTIFSEFDISYDGGQDRIFVFNHSGKVPADGPDKGKPNVTAFYSSNVGIGTASPQAALDVNGSANISNALTVGGGLNIDQANANNGALAAAALTFGLYSGEGIASQRNAEGNQYGLDFYTASLVRMSISKEGLLTANNGATITGPLTASSGANISGLLTANSGQKISGSLSIQNGSYGALSIFSDSADISYDGGPDKIFVFNHTGGDSSVAAFTGSKVGIGTIAPTAKLEVSGIGGTNVDFIVNGRMKSNNDDGGLWVAGDRFVGGYSGNQKKQIGFYNGDWRLLVDPDGTVNIGGSLKLGGQGGLNWPGDGSVSSVNKSFRLGNFLLLWGNYSSKIVGGTITTTSIAFSNNSFSETPVVLSAVNDPAGGAPNLGGVLSSYVSSINKTGFTLGVKMFDGGPGRFLDYAISWIALGPAK